MTALAPTLQAFFTDRLATQRHASGRTVAAYRDALRLLVGFVSDRTGTPPSKLDLADLNAPTIGAFLLHLEQQRHNSVRTRNARLAAIHSFFRYAALRHPEHADSIARVLAIPHKRYDRALACFLTPQEAQALPAAPDRDTWIGRRDHAMLTVAVHTGLRVAEFTGLRCQDAVLTTGPHIRCLGKGRKERCTPLTASASSNGRSTAPPRPPSPPAATGLPITSWPSWTACDYAEPRTGPHACWAEQTRASAGPLGIIACRHKWQCRACRAPVRVAGMAPLGRRRSRRPGR